MTAKPSISGALGLRAWALRALTVSPGAPPACSPATWSLFLGTERCALPLKRRVSASDQHREFDSEPYRVLSEVALRESQRVLCARAELRMMDDIAAQHGWPIAVLKGTVTAVSDPHALDLADVDVLVRPSDAHALAVAVEQAGYRGVGFGSDQHLKGRIAEGQLPIEIHTTADASDPLWSEAIWDRLVPLEGSSHLKQLAPRDHLWHVLTHAVIQHPFRRSAIRDLLLLQEAASACSERELSDVARDIDRSAYAGALGTVLQSARQLSDPGPSQDQLASHAAVVYSVWERRKWIRGPDLFRADVGNWVFGLLLGRAELKRNWSRVLLVTQEPSASRPIAWIEQHAPRLGRVVRVAARAVRLAASALVAMPLALATWFTVRRATKDTV